MKNKKTAFDFLYPESAAKINASLSSTKQGQKIYPSPYYFIAFLSLYILYFIGSMYLETNTLNYILKLDVGEKNVTSISENAVDDNTNGSLVHLTGKVTSNDMVTEPIFNIQEKALYIKRYVEMYQVEKDCSGRSCDYDYKWSHKIYGSRDFSINPDTKPFYSKFFYPARVNLGAFQLAPNFTNQIRATHYARLVKENIKFPETLKSKFKNPERAAKQMNIHRQYIYFGSRTSPKIGDVRVSFKVAAPQVVSVIGKQEGKYIVSYSTDTGMIDLVAQGNKSSNEMFETARSLDEKFTWVIRAVLLIMVWVGTHCLLKGLAVCKVTAAFFSCIKERLILLSFPIAVSISLATISFYWMIDYPDMAYKYGIASGVCFFMFIMLFWWYRNKSVKNSSS